MKIVFSDTFYGRLGAQVKRTFRDETEAEQALNHVLEKLSDNNWEKFSDYRGKSAPETFAHTVSSRLIVDYHRKMYGRLRPPVWLKNNGDLWVSIWKALCLDRELPQTIVDRYSAGRRNPETVHNAIRVIKAKLPWCGVSDRPVQENEAALDNHVGTGNDTEENTQAGLIFASLFLEDTGDGLNEVVEDIQLNAMKKVVSAINLTPEERLILRLYYCEGKSGSAIASALGIPKHQPVRLINKVLDQARFQLLEAGIDLTPA